MSELDRALELLWDHPGVERLVLLGRDGLVIRQLGDGVSDAEALAARIPAMATACSAVGRSAEQGSLDTAVLEFDRGVAIVLSLSADLLLAVLIRPDIGFGPLLRQLRRDRNRLLELL
jgi:predicted regulator of Ras-like GTPase activity (Roadblock/LC7/MglB family)